MSADTYRALVSVTTCRRLPYLRRYLPHLAAFCSSDPRFNLLVALDGTEDDTLAFCREWELPLLYSDEREGVGLSKNRVLERFPDYDHYFFLEDDVEVVDGAAFPAHVEIARASGIHHLSLFARGGVRKPTGESTVAGHRVLHGMYGSANFNYFTREGLERVGGWHPRFAEYRRWGHTEHSYRFYRAGLAPAPFNVAEGLADMFIWHFPPHVTAAAHISADDDQIAAPERELMDRELEHVPVTTLAPHHVNEFAPGPARRLAAAVGSGERYPLVHGAERREARSAYHLWRAATAPSAARRAGAFIAAALNWPRNPALRHAAKTAIGR